MAFDEQKEAIFKTLYGYRTATLEKPVSQDAYKYILEPSICTIDHLDGFRQYNLAEHISQVGKSPYVRAGDVADPPLEFFLERDLAAVWTGYTLPNDDGKEIARGITTLVLFKTADGWKKAGIASSQWQPGEEKTVTKNEPGIMKGLDALNEAFKKRNWDGMERYYLPTAAVVRTENGGAPRVESIKDSMERVKGMVSALPADALVEEHFDDPEIRVCGNLGFVWSKFRFVVGGKQVAHGVDAFTFIKKGDEWFTTSSFSTSDSQQASS